VPEVKRGVLDNMAECPRDGDLISCARMETGLVQDIIRKIFQRFADVFE
jgi:hypothetical protein